AMSPDREGAGGVRRSGGGASVHGGVRLVVLDSRCGDVCGFDGGGEISPSFPVVGGGCCYND
ncbi:hypothetical protein A2U01_0079245, partial [Trifolium medium]|nr:hypothetical protein [Trifolium medium]